jgi:membrane protein DedA with SNARE-associated domain
MVYLRARKTTWLVYNITNIRRNIAHSFFREHLVYLIGVCRFVFVVRFVVSTLVEK